MAYMYSSDILSFIWDLNISDFNLVDKYYVGLIKERDTLRTPNIKNIKKLII